ncbi:MAG: hypothetical protein RLZZ393_812 [Pseudomonadota bacterium]|jgi:hypothetical protein
MAKLNKTQIELLTDAVRHSRGLVCVISGYITSRRNGAYGTRKSAAGRALREAGYLVIVQPYVSTRHPLCHRMGSDIGGETTYQITDAGRAALAAAK